MLKLQGMITALITPMSAEGEIDFPGLQELINRQVRAEVSGILVAGSTGEGPSLSLEEKKSLITTARALIPLSIPLLTAVSSSSTKEMINEALIYEKLGVDAFLVTPPDYLRPSQEGVIWHFEEIHEKLSKPICLYNHPFRTGVEISPDTALHLLQLPRVIALKDAGGNFSKSAEILHKIPEHKTFLSGDDANTLPLISLGASGLISVIGNLFPSETKQWVELALSNKLKESQKHYHKLYPLIHTLSRYLNPPGIKGLMTIYGLPSGNPRKPLFPLSQEDLLSLSPFVNRECLC